MPIIQLESSDRFCQNLFRSGRAFKSLQSSNVMSIYIFSLDGVPYLTFNCQWRLGKSGTSGRRLQAFCSTVSRIVCTLFDSHVTRAICLLWMEKLIQFETYFFLSMRFLLILYKLCCCWNCFHAVLIS